MKSYENPQVTNWALKQAQEKMYRERSGPLHASEIFQCFRKTFRTRTEPEELGKDAILRFAVGFAVQEWFLGPEKDGEEFRGVIFSADRIVKNQVLEFKTTRMSYETYAKDGKGKPDKTVPKVKFDPTSNSGWVDRTRSYCAIHGVKKAHVMVFFLYQNELHTWTFEFTDEELAATLEDIDERRDEMEGYLEREELPPIVGEDEAWQCRFCPFLEACGPDLKAAGREV